MEPVVLSPLPPIQVQVLGETAKYGTALPMPVSMRIMGYPCPTVAQTVGLAFVGDEGRLQDVGHYVLCDGILHRLSLPMDHALQGALEWSMVHTWETPIVPHVGENDDGGVSYPWSFIRIPERHVVRRYGPYYRVRPDATVRQRMARVGLWTMEEDLWPVPGGGWRFRVGGEGDVAESAARIERELMAG